MLGSLAAIAVVVVGGFLALRSVATHEAERDTKSQVQTLGQLVQSAGLSDGVLRGDRLHCASSTMSSKGRCSTTR